VKAENSIDRITSAANPRFFERVPKGAKFDLNIVINIFSHDKLKDDFLSAVFQSLKLVQDDYLGGGGSRGNGQIRFEISQVCSRSADYYTSKADATSLFDLVPEELQKKNRDEKDLQCN
jgi:CRISPR-associated protein Csm3